MTAVSDLETDFAFQVKAAGIAPPVREYRFTAPRRWRFDFAWPGRLIAVEIQGGTWTRGKHTRPAGFQADCHKLCAAAVLGWRVLPVTAEMVSNGEALRLLEEALAA